MLDADTVVRTTCPYCGVGCQLDLHIRNGIVFRAAAPFDAAPNYGKLCVKGRFGHDYLWHPDRLTMPMIRRDDRLVPATWDEALGYITMCLSRIKAESGPDAIAFLASAKCTNEDN